MARRAASQAENRGSIPRRGTMKVKANPRTDTALYQDLHGNMAKAMENYNMEDWPVDRCFLSMVDAAYDTIKEVINTAKEKLSIPS